MKTADMILDELKRQGFRRSAARTAILRVFASSDSPLSVPDIERRIVSGARRFNKTTVYREIEFLKAAGYVTELALRNDVALYELASPHHHHLVCVDCGTVRDVDTDMEAASWKREERRIERKEGFHLLGHSLAFFGQCAKCR
jgi:Fur family ferric uptake transcriptional regulator